MPRTEHTVRSGDVLKEKIFTRVADTKLDSKHRVSLGKIQLWKWTGNEVVFYRVYQNLVGQLILDPQMTIPAHEAWLFRNPKALKMVAEGLQAAQKGELVDVKEEDLGTDDAG
jgi:hypothetical protein